MRSDEAARAFGYGATPARMRDVTVLSVFAVLVLGLSGIGVAFGAVLKPEAEKAACFAGNPCAVPHELPPRSARTAVWQSENGVRLQYDPARWRPSEVSGDRLVLSSEESSAWLEFRVTGRRDAEAPNIGGLPRTMKLGSRLSVPLHSPGIGYIDGDGAWYAATADTAQGPRAAGTIASISAERRGIAVNVTAVFAQALETALSESGRRFRDDVDSILNTVTWDSRIPTGITPRLGLKPPDVAKAYGIRALWARGVRGAGQTIAVVSFDTFRPEDVAEFDRLTGIEGAPPVERTDVLNRKLHVDGFTKEVNIDIDVIRAVAPEARIVNYEVPYDEQNGWAYFLEALTRIPESVPIVSVSWGDCWPAVDAEQREAINEELASLRRRGATVFVASGDAGAYGCLSTRSELETPHLEAVDWPAASPNVVAVGGTRLFVRKDGSYLREAAWEDSLSNRATGGGVSPAHERPGWQAAPGVDNTLSTGKRQVPDVAGPADCDNAFFVVYPAPSAVNPVQKRGPHGCETSAAAPFWAAIAALVRQYAACLKVGDVGFLGEILYELARTPQAYPAFHDVRTGGNLRHDAGPGWDYATGLGSPNAWNLARDVVTNVAKSHGKPIERRFGRCATAPQ